MDRTRLRFLWNYVDLVLLRDVVERHGVTNLAGWRWLVRHLLGHPAAMCSVEKCYVALKSRGIAISKDPLYQLLGFLEDCYRQSEKDS